MNLAWERIKYILAVILYGTIGMFLRHVELPSEIVAMFRGAIGAVFILLYLSARHQRPDREAIRRNRKWLIPAGICLGLNWIFLFAAYMETTVAILGYLEPVVSELCSALFLHEPMKAAGWIGAVLIIGAALVSETMGLYKKPSSGYDKDEKIHQ